MPSTGPLQGVVAHEMGHIVNRDVLYLTVAATGSTEAGLDFSGWTVTWRAGSPIGPEPGGRA